MFEQRRKDMVRPGPSAAPRPPGAEAAARLPPARPPVVTSRSQRVLGAARPRVARAQHVQAFQAGQKQALAAFRKAAPKPAALRAAALTTPVKAPKTVAKALRKPALAFPRQATGGGSAAATATLRAPGRTRFAKPQLDRAALKRAGVNPQAALKAAARRHAQAGALASGFLKRSRQQLGAVRARGRTLGRQLQAAAVRARAQLRAAAGRAQGSLRGHFARSRARVTGRAARTRAQVAAQHGRTLAGLPAATRAARTRVTAAHAQAAAQARTGAQGQKAAVRAAYQAVVPLYAQAGDAVGAQARARAETQARAYESHVTGQDDSFLDGPLTDNRWKARAGAARDVGAAYAPGFRDQAEDEAQHLVGPDGGLGKDLSNIDAALQATLKLLQEQLAASHKRLDARERQARTQAMSAYRSLTAAVQSQLAGTLGRLGRAEQGSVAAVTRQAQAHAAGLDRQASGAQAGLQKSVQGLAGQLDHSLAGFDRQIRASQAPDPKQLARLLAGAQRSVTAGMTRAQAGLGRNVAGLSAGLGQGAAQAGAALGQAAQAGGQQAAGLAGGFDQAGAATVAQAITLFQELTRAHRQGSVQEGQAAGRTLAGLTRGLEDLYGKTLRGLPAELRATVAPLKKALEGNFTNEDAQIRQNAEEAAAQVQPRWKSWVKIALMVAVIIVVAVVAGPAVIAAVGAMAGALGAGAAAGAIGAVVGGAIVGAASGAVIQMANNAVDNIGLDARFQKSVFDGVGKAALIGAAGGALGGAGGALVGKLGAMGALGSGLTQKAAGFALGTTFDLGGNVMGDVMGGMSLGDALKNLTNPQTLMMLAIGTGAGVAAHGVAARNARAATPKGMPVGTGARPSLPERAQAVGERAGNRAGDAVNDLTGNRRGVVRIRENAGLPENTTAVTGYGQGRTRVEHSASSRPQDIRVHEETARQVRAETSLPGRLRRSVQRGLGGDVSTPGSRRWELELEARKHGEMARWREQEAAALPGNHPEGQRLREEADEYRLQEAGYQRRAQATDGETAGTGRVEHADFPHLSRQEYNDFRSRIDSAPLNEQWKVRYERYVRNKQNGGLDVQSYDAWLPTAQRAHANQLRGLAQENAAIDAAGLTNNNYNTTPTGEPRRPVTYTTTIDGVEVTVRPDAVSDTVWADIKALSGEMDVQHFTRQLRGELEGAIQDGKTLMVVLSSDSPEVRPSGPLAQGIGDGQVTVLRRDSKGEWFNWQAQPDDKMGWTAVTQDEVRQAAGSGEVDPQTVGAR